MRKMLLILPLLFTLACEPEERIVPGVPPSDSVPVPADTFEPRHNDPTKKGRPIDKTAAAREIPAPVVEEVVGDFCRQGEACDIAGSGVLAALVNRSNSTFKIIPDAKLFVPGDVVRFVVCAKQDDMSPVVGSPVIAVVKQTRRHIAGDGTTLTGADGCVTLVGTFTAEDQIGDPDNGVPDSGSYIVNAYVGGRLLNQVKVLHDSI